MSFASIEYKKIEIIKRMISRLLLQFQRAPVIIDILCAFAFELQILLDTVEEVVVERSPLDAIGQQLEGLGRIVGQPRIVVDYADTTWFSPDLLGLTVDVAPAWAEGAITAGSLLADDNIYRQLIEAKVYRNFTQYGSVTENQEVALLAFGVNVSYVLTGPMSVDIIIPSTTSITTIKILSDFLNKGQDAISIMPYPPTLKINNIILTPDPPFAPDRSENAVDVSLAAVSWAP